MNKWLIIGILAVLLVSKPVRKRSRRSSNPLASTNRNKILDRYIKLERRLDTATNAQGRKIEHELSKLEAINGVTTDEVNARRKKLRDSNNPRGNPLGLMSKNPGGLFQSFHGVPSKGTRSVNIREPKRLIKLGRLTRINYAPESPSTLAGREYTHSFGDFGHVFKGKNKPVLAVSEDGKQLVVVNDKSTYTFNSRGIVG